MSAGTGGPIPDDVRRFVVEYIDSVPALEALLLMRKSPCRRWTAAMLAAELYMEPQHVKPILADLSGRGLCGTEEGVDAVYFWRPATPALDEALGRLADVYARYLVPVTNLIHSKPRPSVRQFSDAFRLRGNE
ncbi:MAG TPA: hypothetical protein VNN07_11535 [Candidatus Tectomicrobia bacterium]|nr:hypothetical protein [Candidatus Tectomicrobia bacterium]